MGHNPGHIHPSNQDLATVTRSDKQLKTGVTVKRLQMPPEWAEFGAHWGNDGLLYLAEWRRGFTVHELRALFFECQQVRSLVLERDAARRDLEVATAQNAHLERRIAWYRQQVTAEARLYPLLSLSQRLTNDKGSRP